MVFIEEAEQFIVEGDIKIHDKYRKDRRVIIRSSLL